MDSSREDRNIFLLFNWGEGGVQEINESKLQTFKPTQFPCQASASQMEFSTNIGKNLRVLIKTRSCILKKIAVGRNFNPTPQIMGGNLLGPHTFKPAQLPGAWCCYGIK